MKSFLRYLLLFIGGFIVGAVNGFAEIPVWISIYSFGAGSALAYATQCQDERDLIEMIERKTK